MARWEPDTAQRLQAAALELFAGRGFEQTTTADIAAAAGVTERTFFRHFGDKREVLFAGQDRFVQAAVGGAEGAPAGAPPMAVIASAVRATARLFPDDVRPWSRLRQSVIAANPALLERERHKAAGLAAALAGVLRDRDVPEPAATLAAESGATVFGAAFAQWLAEGEQRSLEALVERVLAEFRSVTGGLADRAASA